MNEFYLRELKEEEKVGTDNIYERATAISRLKNEKKNVRTTVKEEILRTPV